MSIVEKTIGSKIHPGLIALVVTICRCNKRKQKRQSFCKICYYRLPLDLKRDLYKRSGQGYEEVYDAAVRHLEKGEARK